ncbi:unnamed protein product [Paramecium pentaurelia]|uniref:Uncharacterized protein n=1 Tax=Paramecium pentaurelia TaxID=43138 RepID=A0A8S1UHJ6_9CILI|nr:unnamed protein product [Paramecium pentaurelia]
MEKKQGAVKQIVSSNCVLISGPINNETGVPMTKFLTLQGIQAPEFSLTDKENPKQEPFGFQAREFLRKQVLGQQIEFIIDHKIKDQNDKVIGRIFKNGQDIGELQLREGLAQLRQQGKPSQEYENAQNLAKQNGKGIWSKKEELVKYNKIELKDVKPKQYTQCFVEDVQGLFVFYAYIPELQGLVKCSYGEVFMPTSVSQVLQNRAKWTIQELILQQEVTLTVQGQDEKFQSLRVDIKKKDLDVKKELVSLGYFRLSPNAFQLINDQKRYNELKETQSQAEIKLIGIWKDAMKQQQQQQSVVLQGGKQTYTAKIIEVHSGDQLTVMNVNNRQQSRVLLASIKAPKYSLKETQPFGYEAKEFVRKHAIGKIVKVEVEYEKKIKPKEIEGLADEDDKKKLQQELNMIFVNIILTEDNDSNLAALIVGAGFATVQPPRGDDGVSRYIDELTGAQEAANKAKKGIHGKPVQLPKMTDLSVNPNLQRSRDAFDSLRTLRKLSGVVELVLNGSRLKLRFQEQNYTSIVVLAGVKCLPNEQNLPDYQKFSNIALQYVKENALQRDVDIELTSIDKKGIFHGHVFLGKQRINLGLTLLELGLAVTFNPVANSHAYQALFADAESKAKLKKEGLWDIKGLDLTIVKGDDDVPVRSECKLLNGELKKLVLVEIADSNTLYFQDPTDKLLGQIEKSLASFTAIEANKLIPPFKKGLLCVAKFSVDGNWYRAKITRELKNRYEVLFIDYGNVDIVSQNDIRKLPENLAALPPQAIRCNLAFITGPSISHELGNKVGQFIRDQIFEKEVVVSFEYQDDISKGVIAYLTKENQANKSLNILLLSQGFAKLDKTAPPLPQKLEEWVKASQEAENSCKGLWNYDEETE